MIVLLALLLIGLSYVSASTIPEDSQTPFYVFFGIVMLLIIIFNVIF